MSSKVRAYSHQGHGRAPINRPSDGTTSLANGSRSIHFGQFHSYAASSAAGCRAPFADLPALAPERGDSSLLGRSAFQPILQSNLNNPSPDRNSASVD